MRAGIAYCAVGSELLSFARMNQTVLSYGWSDWNWIKEPDFQCVIQKRSLSFFISARSTSLLWPHKISYSTFFHSTFIFVQHSGSCLVILFVWTFLYMCSCANGTKKQWSSLVNNTFDEIYWKKKRIAIFICIHVQYELQSQVSIIEHHPQRN